MWIVQSLLALLTCVATIRGQCSIQVSKGLPAKTEPLILNPVTGTASPFRYPENGKLEFARGDRVRLACSGDNNHFVNLTNSVNDIIAVCKEKTEFTVAGVVTKFEDLGCNRLPSSEQREKQLPVVASCSLPYRNYEIGYKINNDFITLIEVCHDPTSISTSHTKFLLSKSIGLADDRKSKAFEECPGHSVIYNDQYDRTVMINTFERILGTSPTAKKYVTNHRTNSLARGHFAASADFIHNTQRLATCYFINQAPQWFSCNSGGWAFVEKAVRNYAGLTNQDLTVYTGGFGIAQLPDVTGNLKDLYLHYLNATVRSIPIPKFYWKVIYNETTRRGIAFVQINNPYLDDMPSNYRNQICRANLPQNSRWHAWRGATHKCVSYVCDVNDLGKNFIIPPFPTVIGLLE